MKYIYFLGLFLFTSSVVGQDIKRENQKPLTIKETPVEKAESPKVETQSSSVKSREVQKENKTSQNSNELPDGFPTYINTGNPEKDREDYKRRKEEWIQSHPEEYKKMMGSQKSSSSNTRTAPVVKKSK